MPDLWAPDLVLGMRKRWKAPNNLTIPARQVWAALFPDPWPKGWRVQWVGFMRGVRGLCVYSEQRVLLGWGNFPEKSGRPVHTLVHEFIHMRCGPGLRHGKEFRELERECLSRIGLEPR